MTDILGNWVDPNALVAEEPALLAEWSTWEGEEMLMLRLFGVPAVHLFQTNHPCDSTMTPKVWENVTWEYKGQQPDGKHAIVLTLGRGVRVVQDGRAGPLQFDIFHAQSRSDFHWPIPRVADLVPVPETDPGALTLYDIPVPLDPTAPGFFPVQRQDDLSATAAQTLDHEMLRAPRMHVAYIPYDLANIDAETAEGVPDNRRLTNFLPDTPPTLLVRQIGNGATRFEWYREGLSDETSSGETGKTPTWAMTLKPKNPHAGHFGYCWSLDYGYLTHRPLDEDLLSELVTDALLDGLLSMTTGIFQPLLSGTPLAADNVRAELSEVIRPFGVAFFRLWYCGDVEIGIDRSSDSDTSFSPKSCVWRRSWTCPNRAHGFRRVPCSMAIMYRTVRPSTGSATRDPAPAFTPITRCSTRRRTRSRNGAPPICPRNSNAMARLMRNVCPMSGWPKAM
ncbi:hypothetical protein [uncultured Celeribacter sp.]|uniref:hypothetical protein n=1 Tax=uncultured Celeribacter sp. TaxID=1303376 RepID=UPI002AA73512|nr:hypothetical protein [uncultured Celeribacter sp.]